MPRLVLSPALARTLVAVSVLGMVSSASEAAAVALLPVQDRASDAAVTEVFTFAFRNEIVDRVEILPESSVRDGLRRLRLRDVGTANPERLRQAAEGLGAEWLIAVTVHDAERRSVPRLAVSARVYSGATGEVISAGIVALSGLDHRSVLELGRLDRIEDLVPEVAERLAEVLWNISAPGDPTFPGATRSAQSGSRLALIPLGATTENRALANAVVATEVAYAAILERGIPLVSANAIRDRMRRLEDSEWGGVSRELRLALRDEGGVRAILVGGVEAYEYELIRGEPRPRVSVALRLIDAENGNILWSDALDRNGWEGAEPFRLGRTYARAQLTQQMMGRLVDRLIESRIPLADPPGGAQ